MQCFICSTLHSCSFTKTLGQKIFAGYEKGADIVSNLFPVWTVLFTLFALRSPQSFSWFTTEYFTAGLAALMLSMGITLTPDDFVQVAKTPVPTIMQFILCYGMMPGLAYGLGKAFGLSPALTAGMVLVGCINGGQASNLCTYIARGNVALSVLMTTATTLGAIVMTPVLCKAILGTVVPVDAAGIAMSTVQVSQIEIQLHCYDVETRCNLDFALSARRSSWLLLSLACR
jgi:bile acid:Na+ symporter, BASS family